MGLTKETIRNGIVAGLAFVLVCSALIGGVLFLLTKEAQLQTQLDAIAKEREQESMVFNLRRIADESLEDRQRLRSAVLQGESQSIDVLTWIEATAPRAGVLLEIQNLERKEDKKEKTQTVEINLAFTGTRDAVERYVTVLEQMPYVSHISQVTILSESLTEWEGVVTLSLMLAE